MSICPGHLVQTMTPYLMISLRILFWCDAFLDSYLSITETTSSTWDRVISRPVNVRFRLVLSKFQQMRTWTWHSVQDIHWTQNRTGLNVFSAFSSSSNQFACPAVTFIVFRVSGPSHCLVLDSHQSLQVFHLTLIVSESTFIRFISVPAVDTRLPRHWWISLSILTSGLCLLHPFCHHSNCWHQVVKVLKQIHLNLEFFLLPFCYYYY